MSTVDMTTDEYNRAIAEGRDPAAQAATPPRRMNAAAVMETMSGLLEAAVTRAPAEPSVSVEFDSTAKRETTPTVKVYAPLGCDLEALAVHAAEVQVIAQEQYRNACAAFPAASGFVTNDGPK